jgi:branched-chain amino acid transport system permease protein
MGAVYALIALGFTTIFRSSNIVNFAQGEFVMLGALLTNFFMITCLLSYLPSALLGIFGVVLIGLGLQVLVIHPIKRAGILIMIMGTLGASIVIRNISLPISLLPKLEYLREPFVLPQLMTSIEAINFAGIRISIQRIWAVAASLILLCLLHYFSNFTRIGNAMESSATDRLAAQLVGIQTERMVLYSFAISAAVGAIGGILIAPIFSMRYDSGAILGLKGFVGAVFRGWGKISGAVLGFILGVVESLCVGLIPVGSVTNRCGLLILIGILYVRPRGIIGRGREVRRVSLNKLTSCSSDSGDSPLIFPGGLLPVLCLEPSIPLPLSESLLLGYTGQISLGQAAFRHRSLHDSHIDNAVQLACHHSLFHSLPHLFVYCLYCWQTGPKNQRIFSCSGYLRVRGNLLCFCLPD